MKIKQIAAQLVIGLLVLILVQHFAGGFVFSKSPTFLFIFLSMIAFSGIIAAKLQVFLLVPKIFPFLLFFHTLVIALIFYLADGFLGGVTLTSISPQFARSMGIGELLKSSGDFGTITTVALFFGSVYQFLIWLVNEK